MKFINPFKKKPSHQDGDTPSAESLHQAASAFVEAVIAGASEEQLRVFELAAKNGSMALHIQIAPTPNIAFKVDPGKPMSFEIKPNLKAVPK